MEWLDVECQNDECGVMFEHRIESENAGDGTGHTGTCPACGARTYFEITYIATVDHGSEQLDEDV